MMSTSGSRCPLGRPGAAVTEAFFGRTKDVALGTRLAVFDTAICGGIGGTSGTDSMVVVIGTGRAASPRSVIFSGGIVRTGGAMSRITAASDTRDAGGASADGMVGTICMGSSTTSDGEGEFELSGSSRLGTSFHKAVWDNPAMVSDAMAPAVSSARVPGARFGWWPLESSDSRMLTVEVLSAVVPTIDGTEDDCRLGILMPMATFYDK